MSGSIYPSTYIFDSTNPRDAWRSPTRLHDGTDLTRRIDNARSTFPNDFSPEYYKRVLVFMVGWDKDEDPEFLANEFKYSGRLRKIFSDRYGYKTYRHILRLEDQNAVDTLAKSFEQKTREVGKDALVIFIYSGHALKGQRTLKDQQTVIEHGDDELNLVCQGPSDACNQVNFNSFRKTYIDSLPNDCLMLMDCCYGSTAAIGRGSKECIAACPVEGETPSGPRSFTSNLAFLLEAARNNNMVYTTNTLFHDLVERTFRLDPNSMHNPAYDKYFDKPVPFLRELPLHTNLNPGRLPIELAPIRDNQRSRDERRKLVASPGISRRGVSAILEVHFEDARETLDREGLQELLSRRYRGRVNVRDLFHTKSSIAIIEMDIPIWYCLQPHPAIRLMCLQGSPGAMDLPGFPPRWGPYEAGESSTSGNTQQQPVLQSRNTQRTPSYAESAVTSGIENVNLNRQQQSLWKKYIIFESRRGLAPFATRKGYDMSNFHGGLHLDVLNPKVAKWWETQVVVYDQTAGRLPYWRRFDWNSHTLKPTVDLFDRLPYDPTIPPHFQNTGPPSHIAPKPTDVLMQWRTPAAYLHIGGLREDELDYDPYWLLFESGPRTLPDTGQSIMSAQVRLSRITGQRIDSFHTRLDWPEPMAMDI
ncbi:hypothetical protein PG985_001353 [Apiospora marii]|uniref:uncharacterized protein n=1 Tax=Apiospora marii TaxID=335849 RepID=UPI00312E9392